MKEWVKAHSLLLYAGGNFVLLAVLYFSGREKERNEV